MAGLAILVNMREGVAFGDFSIAMRETGFSSLDIFILFSSVSLPALANVAVIILITVHHR